MSNKRNSIIVWSLLTLTSASLCADTAQESVFEQMVQFQNNEYGWPALHFAIERGQPEVAAEIIKLFPEQATMHTPKLKLMYATIGNDASQDYDSQIGEEDGISALELAVRKGYLELAESIVNLGADCDEVRTEYIGKISNHWDKRGSGYQYERCKFPRRRRDNYTTQSILSIAVERDDFEMVTLLLDHGATLKGIHAQRNFRDGISHIERTAVHHAAIHASDNILEALVAKQGPSHKPNMDIYRKYASTDSNWPPLHQALDVESDDFLELAEAGEDITWQGRAPKSILTMIVEQENWMLVECLVHGGISMSEIIDEMIKQNKESLLGEELDKVISEHFSPIHLEMAVELGRIELVEQILKANVYSDRALEIAIEKDDLEVATLLLKVYQLNLSSMKGLDLAIHQKSVKMVELLTRSGRFQKDFEGEDELLSAAIRSGEIEIYSLVKEAGYTDSDIWNAFVDSNCVEMLEDYLQEEIHASTLQSELHSMKRRAVEKGKSAMLDYLMSL